MTKPITELIKDDPSDVVSDLIGRIQDENWKGEVHLLSEKEQVFVRVCHAHSLIGNGGLRYFFECGPYLHDQGIETAESFSKIGCFEVSKLLHKGLTIFPQHMLPMTEEGIEAAFSKKNEDFLNDCDEKLFKYYDQVDKKLVDYVRENISAFMHLNLKPSFDPLDKPVDFKGVAKNSFERKFGPISFLKRIVRWISSRHRNRISNEITQRLIREAFERGHEGVRKGKAKTWHKTQNELSTFENTSILELQNFVKTAINTGLNEKYYSWIEDGNLMICKRNCDSSKGDYYFIQICQKSIKLVHIDQEFNKSQKIEVARDSDFEPITRFLNEQLEE